MAHTHIYIWPVCETHRLSNLIDILLKPFIKQVKSFIRDDIDFLSYIPNTVDENAILVSFDVTSLYTNISHELGLEAIKFWLEKHPNLIHKRFTKDFIIEGIKTILENNNFMFDGCTYNQVRGTAMGTKFAPTYATLVLAYLEEKLYTHLETDNKEMAEYVKRNWKRFLDDCFMIWINPEDDLTKFHDLINNLHQDIKFTIEKSKTHLPFLDILLLKYGTQLKTDIYFKVTDTKQYLNFYSCHPRHTKRSIPYNLARRICTIVSDEKLREKRLSELRQSLLKRNYPKSLIQNGIDSAKKIPRKDLLKVNLKTDECVLPYVSTHNPRNPEAYTVINQHLPILYADSKMKEVLKDTTFIKSKRQLPNLKKTLTKAKFTSSTTTREANKVTKCNKRNCGLCQHIVEQNFFDFNGKIFYVNANMSCDVKNVLYVIRCLGCNEYYIGQTGGKLRDRRTVHAQQIRDPSTRQIPLSAHLDMCSKVTPKFVMFPFFKIKTETTSARIAKEHFFIKCFKPLLNASNLTS